MIQSMTGFGSAEEEGCKVEIRSLNHRYLEISVRAPSSLARHEIEFRNAAKRRFTRGKVEISIQLDPSKNSEFVPDFRRAEGIYLALRNVKDTLSIPGEPDIAVLARFHDLFIETKDVVGEDKVFRVLENALAGLQQMRESEGIRLTSVISSLAGELKVLNGKIRDMMPQVIAEQKNRFTERITAILDGVEVDGNRLLQEAAILATKADISEELARIESHLLQLNEFLGQGDIIGRKLDFISQELNREANTISAKTPVYEVASLAVEMKTVIEQMREQAQNIQ